MGNVRYATAALNYNDELRLSGLENIQLKVSYYEEITSLIGQVSIPAQATILLDQWENWEDALLSEMAGGKPTFESGNYVDSFDINGNYTITGDPLIEQVKLHTDRIEIENRGIFKFGQARTPVRLEYGVSNIIPNETQTPLDQAVAYSPDISAGFLNNRFATGKLDGFIVIVNRKFGLDTSIPLTFSVSYYIDGTATGDIDFVISTVQVNDDFSYSGSIAAPTYRQVQTIETNNGDKIRRTVDFLIPINKLSSNSGIVISLSRDAQISNPTDTVTADLVVTNIAVDGYIWKM